MSETPLRPGEEGTDTELAFPQRSVGASPVETGRHRCRPGFLRAFSHGVAFLTDRYRRSLLTVSTPPNAAFFTPLYNRYTGSIPAMKTLSTKAPAHIEERITDWAEGRGDDGDDLSKSRAIRELIDAGLLPADVEAAVAEYQQEHRVDRPEAVHRLVAAGLTEESDDGVEKRRAAANGFLFAAFTLANVAALGASGSLVLGAAALHGLIGVILARPYLSERVRGWFE